MHRVAAVTRTAQIASAVPERMTSSNSKPDGGEPRTGRRMRHHLRRSGETRLRIRAERAAARGRGRPPRSRGQKPTRSTTPSADATRTTSGSSRDDTVAIAAATMPSCCSAGIPRPSRRRSSGVVPSNPRGSGTARSAEPATRSTTGRPRASRVTCGRAQQALRYVREFAWQPPLARAI